MITKHTTDTLRETFITGLLAVFKIAGYKKTFFSVWFTKLPIYVSIVTSILFYFCKLDFYEGIMELKVQMLNFLPGILGFTIAGYSLMVGFIQAGMLDKISEPTYDSNFSLYQKMSSTFAVNVILQAIALIIAYFVHFVIFIDTKRGMALNLPSDLIYIVNILGFVVLTYWFWISLLMVIQVVLNIFSFSQLHHYFVNKQKVDSQMKSNSNDKN
jgi:hypothetical protein